jgi:ParB family chromosome partitioning protein
MPATETYVPGTLYEMSLVNLHPDPNQPRKYLDPAALEELIGSVREHKVIAPILFRVENGLCYVVAGERRCIAAGAAGLTTVPAIFTDSPTYEELSLNENTARADLTAVEEAEALDRLQRAKSYKQEDLARIMGKSVPLISMTLSLNRLPQTIRDECRKDPTVPKRVLIEIAGKKQERSMLKAYEAYRASLLPRTAPQGGATQAEALLKAAGAAQRKIEALAAGKLTQAEKEALKSALEGLKGAAEALLAALAKPALKLNRKSAR